MNILYIAKHGPQDNEDEDAISFALRKLGHTVNCMSEQLSVVEVPKIARKIDADFVLFHKWTRAHMIYKVSKVPLVFWDFDMVWNSDPILDRRCAVRMEWYRSLMPHITVGFCTDGDWQAKDSTGKLVHMMQGADERKVGYGTPTEGVPPILFTGSIRHGQVRAAHIHELEAIYGDKIRMIGNGRDRIHGKDLSDMLASVKIAISPDSPCTDNYWSNRVYLTLGLGGFLIHSRCKQLMNHYTDNELCYYDNRQHLIELIDHYLVHDEERECLRRQGHRKTLSHHLYRHRCEMLIDVVQSRLKGKK